MTERPFREEAMGAPVRGWCPGALRPMRAGDGLIVRPRITGGVVDVALAVRIAEWSRCWGNGKIELSSRANLQLRGISDSHLADLHAAMVDWHLLDTSAAAEAVRNVVSSPLAGLDARAVLDIRPIVAALEHRLAAETELHALPGKFGFAIGDGGAFGLDDVLADINFAAQPGMSASGTAGPAFSIRLAGAPDDRFHTCSAATLVDTAAALAGAFLSLRRGREARIRRMRDCVAMFGVEAIMNKAASAGGLIVARTGQATARETMGRRDEVRARAEPVLLGLDPLAGPRSADAAGPVVVGVGLPFGAIAAGDFAALASVAAEAGATDIRLTPWRAILIPVPSIEAGCQALSRLTALPLILEARDPRRRIAACPGAPACEHGTTPTRDDAARLAERLAPITGPDILVHVSGCQKGCAHAREAPITLVARDGRYDLIANGSASRVPGRRGLSLDQALDHVVSEMPQAAADPLTAVPA